MQRSRRKSISIIDIFRTEPKRSPVATRRPRKPSGGDKQPETSDSPQKGEKGRRTKSGAGICHGAPRSAKVSASVLTRGYGFDRPKGSRRAIAALLQARFFVAQSHGISASAVSMGVPCGTPSGVPDPRTRSVNPHGAARLLTGARGLLQSVRGASHE